MVKRSAGQKMRFTGGTGIFSALFPGLLLCLLPFASQALPAVDPLYELSLLAIDQSEGERQKSLQEGLEKVIVRISGQTDFRDNPAIREALDNPEPYLQQFSYISLSDAEKAELKTLTDTKNRLAAKANPNKLRPELPPTIRIKLSFSPEATKALLRRAQLSIWPASRPSVLVWVVIDGGKAGKRLLSSSDQAQGFLLNEASRRGLPLVLPMNDLKDQLTLGAERLWNLDQVAIAEASQRYGEGSVLVGKAAQLAGGQWQGSWLYLLKGQSWSIASSGDDLEALLGQGVGEAVRIQVERYGIRPDSVPGTAFLIVSGVNNLQKYASTLLFLKNLEVVKSLRVTEVKGDLLYCALDIDGDSQMLRELIALGHVLVAEDENVIDQVADAKVTATLRYHLSTE